MDVLCWVAYITIGIVVYSTIGGAAAGISTRWGFKESNEILTPSIIGGVWPLSLLACVFFCAYIASTWTIFYPAAIAYKTLAKKPNRWD